VEVMAKQVAAPRGKQLRTMAMTMITINLKYLNIR
jgi:hypothetical protein